MDSRRLNSFTSQKVVVHPRTWKKLDEFGLSDKIRSLPKIDAIEPLPYLDFLSLLSHSNLVITDSGGVQEEANVLKKPVLTLRNTTPRWETVFSRMNVLVGLNPELIIEAARFALERDEMTHLAREAPSLYGDGRSGERIVNIIRELCAKGELKYPETIAPKSIF